MEFFSNYPIAKWVLIGIGVLAVLSKYLKFDPIEKWLSKRNEYTFEEINHLNNDKLKQLIASLNQGKWIEVKNMLTSFNSSYQSFGFRALGQYGEIKKINEWITQEPTNDLPQIIKAYYLVHQGWEIRGRHSIDTVSKKNLEAFKSHLEEARSILKGIKNDDQFQANIHALLLKTYKALNVDRREIHSVYKEANARSENHAELNFNYFSAISPKWGGSKDEVEHYLMSLGNKSTFINNLILAQSYFDFVHMEGGEDKGLQIKNFIEEMKSFQIDKDELYRFEFYLLLKWLANNLGYLNLENYYEQLVQPYWRD